MDINEILLEEIRAVRIEVKECRRDIAETRMELTLFKGKAFGFITLLAFLINGAIAFIKDK